MQNYAHLFSHQICISLIIVLGYVMNMIVYGLHPLILALNYLL